MDSSRGRPNAPSLLHHAGLAATVAAIQGRRWLARCCRRSRRPDLTGEPLSLLRFAGVSKRFGGALAVDRVDLDGRARSILALLGENGAGKSTLIKLLAGIHGVDE